MQPRFPYQMIVFVTVVLTPLHIFAQTTSQTLSDDQSWRHAAIPYGSHNDWKFTTKAYQREATRVLITETDSVARGLNLPEKLPITSNDLIEVHIPPPGLGMLGTLTTSNYTYYVTLGRKFTGVDRRNLTSSFYELKAQYLWRLELMDTNDAFRSGMEIMRKAGMDIAALNRDCQVAVTASGPYGDKFVPDYWIAWTKNGQRIGLLELFAPTHSIRQLHVMDKSYILRKPVEVPNLGRILKDGNAPKFLLKRMGLDETNGVAHDLSDGTSFEVTTNKMK